MMWRKETLAAQCAVVGSDACVLALHVILQVGRVLELFMADVTLLVELDLSSFLLMSEFHVLLQLRLMLEYCFALITGEYRFTRVLGYVQLHALEAVKLGSLFRLLLQF